MRSLDFCRSANCESIDEIILCALVIGDDYIIKSTLDGNGSTLLEHSLERKL